MTTSPQYVSEPGDGPGSPRRRATTSGCTSPATPPTRRAGTSRSSCAARAPTSGTTQGKRYLDGLAGLFTVQAGHGRTELAEAAAKQMQELAFFPLWSYAHPAAIELAERLVALRARRPQPRLLHHRWRRGRRVGLEAGQAVLQAHRQAHEAQGDQPQRSPTTAPRRARCRSPASRTPRSTSSRWCPARSGAEHELLPRAAARRRHRGLRPLGRRPHRRGHRVRGPRHRRGRLPRAGAELRRLLPAAPRLPRAGARDLRRVRRAHGRRRDDLRVRPHRRDVRDVALRRHARHHHLREGHDLRLRAHRRDDRERPPLRAVQARARTTSPTATPSAGTPCRPRSRWPTSTSSSARASTSTCATTRPPSAPRSRSCSTCRSSATCAAPGTSTASSS